MLTNSISLSKGVYIVIGYSAYSSVPFAYKIGGTGTYLLNGNWYSGNSGTTSASGIIGAWIAKVDTSATVRIESATSNEATFSYTERGGISAVRII